MTDLSLILPAYNAAAQLDKNLPIVIQHFSRLALDTEIIIVDDGSPDGDAVRSLARRYSVHCITLPINRGKGAAVRAGMLAATGQVRIFSDADIPYALANLDHFYQLIQAGQAQIVVGDRTLPGAAYFGQVPLARQLGSHIFSFFAGRFLVGGHFDTQCGLKAFQDDVARDLFAVSRINRFAIDVELLYVALKRGYRIVRQPVQLRGWEPSGIHLLKDGLQMLGDTLTIPLNYRLGKYAPRPNRPLRQP